MKFILQEYESRKVSAEKTERITEIIYSNHRNLFQAMTFVKTGQLNLIANDEYYYTSIISFDLYLVIATVVWHDAICKTIYVSELRRVALAIYL